jgi:DNA-binding CsgD family transcriptional regulator
MFVDGEGGRRLSTTATDAEVIGRDAELEAIERLLEGGGSRVLVLEGGPGIGKTTLWLAGLERAHRLGHRVLCARPAPVESSLSLAGLGDLFAGVAGPAREGLPEVQRRALAAALAEEEQQESAAPGGNLLGVAVLGALSALAAEEPLLVAIDDLQWLDEATGAILVYAFRRLGTADARLLATCRGEPGRPLPCGLEQAVDPRSLTRLGLEPLSEGAIRRLVRIRLGLSLPRLQMHALYEATQGNPFFALEVGRAGLKTDASGLVVMPRSLQRLVGARLEALPRSTRDALPFVAALATRSESVLNRAGVWKDLEPALDAGVLELDDGRVRFTHPLIATVVWSGTNATRRQEVHRALADAVEDPEQRSLHLAAVADSPDRDVAALLEEAAASAARRGAPAAAADLLDRARTLMPADAMDDWARLTARATSAHAEAGHWDSVRDLVEEAQQRLPPGPERAEILVTEAEMRPGLEELLRQAAAEAGESAAGVRALIGGTEQAGFAGRWSDAVETARKAVALARALGDRGLLGVALTWLGGLKLIDSQLDGWHELEEALAIEQDLGSLPTTVFQSPRTWQGAGLIFADDPNAGAELLEERLATASEHGDDMSAFQAMRLLTLAELRCGDWTRARSIGQTALDQVETIGYEYGRPVLLGGLAGIEACEGGLERARALGTESVSTLTGFGDRYWSTFAVSALVLTELCAGNAAAALAYADEISSRFPGRESWWPHHQGDELEALVLAGEHERALTRAEALRRAGAELDLPRFLAWAARGEGLVHEARGDLSSARAALEEALDHHARYALPFEQARTLLAYGHVLRRQARRRAAREVLGEALAAFELLGARHFVAATQAELQHVGGRPPVGEHELTGAEDRIARLVAAGLSNKEVAARLYVTVSTVEATLTRVYAKLGLTSRSQLAHTLAGHVVER